MEITTQDIIDEYKNEYKQKLINYLNNDLQIVSEAQCLYIKSLLKCIENGEFDNDNS
ncbi:hypothetical protein [Spiroplasma endosymbiont of Tiphia femorata]|uniref:hypothetical protein n=1 Tax=Spiroplasma endosymbiont of Tiphia femorata TaxID=3066326 RepID=UPI0030D58883